MKRERVRRAVFLDRDGVLNANVWYPDTGCWEAPRTRGEFALVPEAGAALRELAAASFLLFVVTNQPNTAKGKCPHGELERTHARLHAELAREGVLLDGLFCCPHHPAFTGPCHCRKPAPFFLLRAIEEHELTATQCWMVGDRSTDMLCGRAAGVQTVWIDTGQESEQPAPALYDQRALSIRAATAQILANR